MRELIAATTAVLNETYHRDSDGRFASTGGSGGDLEEAARTRQSAIDSAWTSNSDRSPDTDAERTP